jgi:hypothetical protein
MKSPGAFVGSVSPAMNNDSPAVIVEREFQGWLVLLPVCLEPPKGFEIIDLTGPGAASVREKEEAGLWAFAAVRYSWPGTPSD